MQRSLSVKIIQCIDSLQILMSCSMLQTVGLSENANSNSGMPYISTFMTLIWRSNIRSGNWHHRHIVMLWDILDSGNHLLGALNRFFGDIAPFTWMLNCIWSLHYIEPDVTRFEILFHLHLRSTMDKDGHCIEVNASFLLLKHCKILTNFCLLLLILQHKVPLRVIDVNYGMKDISSGRFQKVRLSIYIVNI
jgi:hypothetical protein